MPQYVVTEDCYVPVGESTRFKRAGQVVTLSEADAKVLGGLVKSASKKVVEAQVVADREDDSEGVQKVNTASPNATAVSDAKSSSSGKSGG